MRGKTIMVDLLGTRTSNDTYYNCSNYSPLQTERIVVADKKTLS